MPRSKRSKVVTLTKTKKKGREWKEGLLEQVRKAIEDYPLIYLFKHYNLRNDKLKELRESLPDSKFILGSNKILQVALGKTETDEAKPNLHLISEKLKGQVGLFFTKLSREEVNSSFESFEQEEFARSGARATHDFELSAGPLSGPRGPLEHTMEPQLRKYGLPTKLNKGVIELLADHRVCSEGQILDPNQAALLRVFDVKMSTFRLKLLGCWTAEGETYEELAEDDDDDAAGDEVDIFETVDE
mmetsp:Transcript_29086/g.53454  ORF Transcript_29086/g.53454 Transcript_29086/m.53454 type:complete len:244 (-) Transcript_29086:453-1184(-)|eukprot:CAMPEP_0175053156 /NCGR_PEP_ID=MMETSP0052_2-20121109/8766_1 /TAXON_ID=51329 ORGANISM="Polytomella parva, Strain SAG 63-3" /NCGR_SAMPLE_ID=MMETSP0052_2 /ASSEMBLY_ACC=CAM_ASM_000194 /LENGTH=243 /DNA_ID=CAMNT_0016317655 /DNA_START=70 /DNA_END=801 /DNA_ORIENTATION=+